MSTVPCKGCEKPIRWVEMATGARMPVDEKTVQVVIAKFDAESGRLTEGKMVKGLVPHWQTCPKAKEFKKP